MKVDPFIEAEEAAGHSVNNAVACSRSPVPPTTSAETGPLGPVGDRRRAHREDHRHPRRVQGHLWIPPGPPRARPPGRGLREAPGDEAHADRRPGGPVQEALEEDDRCRSRCRGGPRPHPAPLRAVRGDRPPLCRRHHLHRHLGGLGLPGHRHRPGQPQGRRLGAGRPHADRAGRGRTVDGLRQPGPEQGVIFHSDRGCQYTSKDFADLARANGVVLSVGRKGECWDNAVAESFFATIKRELIDTRAWPTTSRTAPRRLRVHRGLVQHPAVAQLPRLPQPPTYEASSTTTPTVRRHDQPKQPVRRTGSSPTWAVESAGGLGYLLSQQLVEAGERVLDVPATLASRVRVLGTGRSNKNDPNDALLGGHRRPPLTGTPFRRSRPIMPRSSDCWPNGTTSIGRPPEQAGRLCLHAVLAYLSAAGGISKEAQRFPDAVAAARGLRADAPR